VLAGPWRSHRIEKRSWLSGPNDDNCAWHQSIKKVFAELGI
jgi:hypothetical protein